MERRNFTCKKEKGEIHHPLGSLATMGTVFHFLYIFLYHLLGFCAGTYYFRNLQIKISLHSQNNFKNYHCALRFSSLRRDPVSLLKSLFISVSQQLEGNGGRLKCSFLFTLLSQHFFGFFYASNPVFCVPVHCIPVFCIFKNRATSFFVFKVYLICWIVESLMLIR